MSQVKLVNIGSAPRIVTGLRGVAVSVGVGEIKSADLDDLTVSRLKRNAAKETLLIIDADAKLPHRLTRSLELLKDFAKTPYDDLLKAAKAILGVDITGVRPTKPSLRLMLSEVAKRIGRQEFTDAIHQEAQRDPSSVPGDIASDSGSSDKAGAGSGDGKETSGGVGNEGASQSSGSGKNSEAEGQGSGSGEAVPGTGADTGATVPSSGPKLFGERAESSVKPKVKTK
jgi:hypothetical protein